MNTDFIIIIIIIIIIIRLGKLTRVDANCNMPIMQRRNENAQFCKIRTRFNKMLYNLLQYVYIHFTVLQHKFLLN